MGTVWVSYGWTRRKPLENQGASGTNGDTELFEKPSNINGFGTFGQQIFLLLTS